MFFEINKNICNTYSGLNPLNLLDYPAEDVFELIASTIDYNKRNEKKRKDVPNVKRKPAGDDWF